MLAMSHVSKTENLTIQAALFNWHFAVWQNLPPLGSLYNSSN